MVDSREGFTLPGFNLLFYGFSKCGFTLNGHTMNFHQKRVHSLVSFLTRILPKSLHHINPGKVPFTLPLKTRVNCIDAKHIELNWRINTSNQLRWEQSPDIGS